MEYDKLTIKLAWWPFIFHECNFQKVQQASLINSNDKNFEELVYGWYSIKKFRLLIDFA
jgi:hypothetical protein